MGPSNKPITFKTHTFKINVLIDINFELQIQ